MKLTVINCQGRYPSAGHGCNSYLISHGGANIALDMGSGAVMNFLRHTEYEKLSAVVLTHLHYDHIADIFSLFYISSYRKRTRKLKVFLPRTPNKIAERIAECQDFDIVYIDEGMKTDIGGIRMEFYSMTHPVETYGVKLYTDKVLSYTSDTTYNENLVRLIDGADTVLGDCCILEKDWTDKSPHISVAHLAMLAAGKRLLLGHLPENGREGILSEAMRYNAKSVLLYDGMVVKI